MTLARTTYNDVLRVGVCPEMRPMGVAKKRKKGNKLSCVIQFTVNIGVILVLPIKNTIM